MRRIMFVCLSLSNGGAERVVSVLADELNKKKYEVFILVLSQGEQTYSIPQNVHIITPQRHTNGALGKALRILAIREAIIQHRIDTVIAFSHYNAMYTVVANVGLHARIIGSERNDPAQIDNRPALKKLREILYKQMDCLVCQTADAKAYFPEAIQKKSVIIMNPIKGDLPERYEGRREKRIVSFSRLEPQKNIKMLLDAFYIFQKEFPDYVLEIYGDGSEKKALERHVEKLDLKRKVSIKPFEKNIHIKVLKARMFALSSDYEGLSNSMIESLAIGIPTIMTDCPCGGARMVIKNNENGILVPVRDSEKMYQAMKRIALDDDLTNRLSKNGTLIRNTLNATRIAEQWMSIID